jgi:hypothetical protein
MSDNMSTNKYSYIAHMQSSSNSHSIILTEMKLCKSDYTIQSMKILLNDNIIS